MPVNFQQHLAQREIFVIQMSLRGRKGYVEERTEP
jgi:hypothetical protein